jgi:diacylglycerol kinase family enzyme
MIAGVPVRVNTENIRLHDVGKISYKDAAGRWQQRYFIINASIGVTAFANRLYNSGASVVEWLQKRSVNLAILWTALQALRQYHNIVTTLTLNGAPSLTAKVTNLGIIKNPHFAGNFCYDTTIAPDSGNFVVNLCEDMNLLEMLKILYHLSHHSFTGIAKTRSWRSSHFCLETPFPIPLETDGEIVMTNEVEFEIIPQNLRVCQ